MQQKCFAMQVYDKKRFRCQFYITCLQILPTTKSDHLAVIFSCKISASNSKIKKIFADFSANNIVNFKGHATNLYENQYIKSNNIHTEINAFIHFNTLIKRFCLTKIKFVSTTRL